MYGSTEPFQIRCGATGRRTRGASTKERTEVNAATTRSREEQRASSNVLHCAARHSTAPLICAPYARACERRSVACYLTTDNDSSVADSYKAMVTQT